jgi:hypothetical protein
MMPAATAGSTLVFGGTISADAAVGIVLIVGGIFITLRP